MILNKKEGTMNKFLVIVTGGKKLYRLCVEAYTREVAAIKAIQKVIEAEKNSSSIFLLTNIEISEISNL